jgi:hypothetical protein
MDESDHRISFNRLKKSATSLPTAIGALRSPLGPHPESDLASNLYCGSTPIANMDESNHRISFNLLNKSMISLSTVIGASGSPLGSHLEKDLATDLYSGSTLIAIKDESNRWIRFRWLQEIYNIATRGDQGIGLSSRNPSKNRSRYKSILWLYPISLLWRYASIQLQGPFEVIKHLVDLSLSCGHLTQEHRLKGVFSSIAKMISLKKEMTRSWSS